MSEKWMTDDELTAWVMSFADTENMVLQALAAVAGRTRSEMPTMPWIESNRPEAEDQYLVHYECQGAGNNVYTCTEVASFDPDLGWQLDAVTPVVRVICYAELNPVKVEVGDE
jgi:hypothetical protein